MDSNTNISKLKNVSRIGKQTVKNIRQAGLRSLQDVATCTDDVLLNISGVGEKTLINIREYLAHKGLLNTSIGEDSERLKEEARSKLKGLVGRFSERVQELKRLGTYDEATARVDWINPFFSILGWDIRNDMSLPESHRDVIHEDKIKISGSKKAPDYCFTIFGKKKFFVEAKKPKVDIDEQKKPALQVRRYGWNAKLPLSIVTDFEEFAVYECNLRPKESDSSRTSRIKYMTYEDYLNEFDYIWNHFSKKAVQNGSIEEYSDIIDNKKGSEQVDEEFLDDIRKWRIDLAKNIAIRNKRLNEKEVNYAVQKIIDRVIFLRISEDRGIEEYEQLKNTLRGENYYKNMIDLFNEAEEKYNSGIFDFEKDTITRDLKIDNDCIKKIIRELYFPKSPYEFSMIPSDILGQVYEKFLGEEIRLTPENWAKVEEKPRVRRTGGVYYTPSHIVDYIVDNTLGNMIDGKTPKQIEELSIVDPACGSGSFLLGAYEYLLDYHLQYYHENYSENKQNDLLNEDGDLKTSEKKRILINNIYGVDIDQQAVEVTKLNLLLKALEGETKHSIKRQLKLFHERVLPSLDDNIKCGNSLIGPDFFEMRHDFSKKKIKQCKAFSWDKEFSDVFDKGGFDAVIGNPPYDVLEKERKEDIVPHEALHKYVKKKEEYNPALGGKLNLFRFFLVKFLEITKNEKHFGLIIPLSILADKSCDSSRKFLFKSADDLTAECFPQKDKRSKRVFKDAKLSTVVVTGKRDHTGGDYEKKEMLVRTYPWDSFEDSCKEAKVEFGELKLIDEEHYPVPLVDSEDWDLLVKIYQLDDVVRLDKIDGLEIRRGEINQTTYEDYITENTDHARLVKGVEVGQYRLNSELSQGKVEFFNEDKYLRENEEKDFVQYTRIATQRITGIDERLRIVATLIKPPAYFADSTNSLHLDTDMEKPYNLKYFLGHLNSKLFQWRFKLTSTNNNVATNELNALPIKQLDFNTQQDINKHDKIVEWVNNLLELNSKLEKAKLEQDRKQLKRRIRYINDNIDTLIFNMYNLTDEEIAMVEDSLKS